jgi:hypothetical protein
MEVTWSRSESDNLGTHVRNITVEQTCSATDAYTITAFPSLGEFANFSATM